MLCDVMWCNGDSNRRANHFKDTVAYSRISIEFRKSLVFFEDFGVFGDVPRLLAFSRFFEIFRRFSEIYAKKM